MTSPTENATRLDGMVLDRLAHPSVPRWDVLRLAVDSAAPVEGRANLLGETAGSRLQVCVDRDVLPDGDLRGWHFEGLVRLAGPETVTLARTGDAADGPRLTPPQDGDPGPTEGSARPAAGDPPAPGTWPAGDAGPRPEL